MTDDTKLSGSFDMPEGRDVSQRDLDWLEKWAQVNLAKLNKTKCNVLHLGYDNHKYQYRPRNEWFENSPVENDLRI